MNSGGQIKAIMQPQRSVSHPRRGPPADGPAARAAAGARNGVVAILAVVTTASLYGCVLAPQGTRFRGIFTLRGDYHQKSSVKDDGNVRSRRSDRLLWSIVGYSETGDGLDNIDYLPTKDLLYAAASEAAVLTVDHVDKSGKFTRVRTVPTVRGARGVVVDSEGHAYVMDPFGGRILKVSLQ